MKPLRLAVIGCGAVTEKSHLPALARVEGIEVTALVDTHRPQLEHLQSAFQIPLIGSSFIDLIDSFDMAVVATPSATHYEIGRQLLVAGKHVLMEKPLASHYKQAVELTSHAKREDLMLAVNLVRRYLPHFKLFKSLLDSSILGMVHRFEVEEGGVFNWLVQSASFYDTEQSGGGVLIDNGAHILDALLWWLGDFESVTYSDDAHGGVEADCHLKITLKSGAIGLVTMSRLRKLKNSITVYGERGTLKMDLSKGKIELQPRGQSQTLVGEAKPENNAGLPTILRLFEWHYKAILASINAPTKVSHGVILAQDSLHSIRLIEQCYKSRVSSDFLAW